MGIVVSSLLALICTGATDPGQAAERSGGQRVLASPQNASAQLDRDAKLAHILDEWQQKSAARTSVDLWVTRQDDEPAWGTTTFTGRVVLHKPGRALVEFAKTGRNVSPDEKVRLVWLNGKMHEFKHDVKHHFIFKFSGKHGDRLPGALALPFLWNMSTEDLKARYQVQLVKEDHENLVLGFEPLTDTSWSFSKAYLQLNRATYLPRRYLLLMPDEKSRRDYRVTRIQSDQPIPDDVFDVSDRDGWVVEGGEIDVQRLKPIAIEKPKLIPAWLPPLAKLLLHL